MNKVEIDRKVKIAGTDFDRRRRYNDDSRQMMKDLHDLGYTIPSISKAFNASYTTVKYIVSDDEYRKEWNEYRKQFPFNFPPTSETFLERVDYKLRLIKDGKL